MSTQIRVAISDKFDGLYQFRVWQYEVSHSRLNLKVTRTLSGSSEEGYLFLENVQYYEGPFYGTGYLRNGDVTTCLDILRRIPAYIAIPDAHLLESFALLEITNGESLGVRVVLQNAEYYKSTDVSL
jgi:hypothetical protein